MSIDNSATPPLAAVHSLVDTSPREKSGSGSLPRPAHSPDAHGAPAPVAEADPPGPKHVQLPDFPNYELSFRLDKEHGRVVIQVIDSKTGTIVRTVPPEDLVHALRHLPDGRGVLLDREG
jgi:hypothetical protein